MKEETPTPEDIEACEHDQEECEWCGKRIRPEWHEEPIIAPGI